MPRVGDVGSVPELLEHRCQYVSNRWLIIDHEHREGPGCGGDAVEKLNAHRDVTLDHGKQNRKCGSTADLALKAELPAMGLNDSVRDAEPEPCSLSYRLRGQERVED